MDALGITPEVVKPSFHIEGDCPSIDDCDAVNVIDPFDNGAEKTPQSDEQHTSDNWLASERLANNGIDAAEFEKRANTYRELGNAYVADISKQKDTKQTKSRNARYILS